MSRALTILSFAICASLPSLGASFFSGSDTACFYGSPDTSCTLSSSTTSLGFGYYNGPPLSYTPNAAGFNAPATGGTIDLGTFSFNEDLFALADGTFDIDLTFTAPAGAGGQTYTAEAFGFVLLGWGGAEIDFNEPTDQTFSYAGGSFDVLLPSTVSIDPGCSQELYATITPEPVSAGAVGLGIALLVVARRFILSGAPRRPAGANRMA